LRQRWATTGVPVAQTLIVLEATAPKTRTKRRVNRNERCGGSKRRDRPSAFYPPLNRSWGISDYNGSASRYTIDRIIRHIIEHEATHAGQVELLRRRTPPQ
jgi:hypothetical protein